MKNTLEDIYSGRRRIDCHDETGFKQKQLWVTSLAVIIFPTIFRYFSIHINFSKQQNHTFFRHNAMVFYSNIETCAKH